MHRYFSSFQGRACLTALAALAALAGPARAEDGLARPEFKTQHAGSCPEERAETAEPRDACSTARLLYPYYPETPWLTRLIAQSVILPMFSKTLDKKLPPLSPGETPDARYLELLRALVSRDGKAAPRIEFSATLAGSDENNRSRENTPWPEHFGPLLQLSLSYTLSREGEAHPPAPLGGFIVIDTGKRKILTFGDLILPGRGKALEALQREAFRVHLKTRGDMTDEAIEEHLAAPPFTFHLGKNWRIVKDGLAFGYAMYEIGPRPFGAPEIFIAKHDLRSIVQPGILAHIP
ncbi:MAG: RsiV family protein [Azoarcus sp.]|jgi:hypothetical protein|nr:RsiV family protein [Azoarcus sp.]